MKWKWRVGLSIIIFVLIFKNINVPIDPSNKLSPPTLHHILGTDYDGRDAFWLNIEAARYSLLRSVAVVILDLTLGSILALISARFFGHILDLFLIYIAETLRAFPGILFALLISAFGGGLFTALFILYWIPFWRVGRTQLRVELEKPYYEAAIALGLSPFCALARHTLPNVFPSLWTLSIAVLAETFVAQSALEFIGLGAPLDQPSIGNQLLLAIRFSMAAPWVWLPSLLLMATFIAILRRLGYKKMKQWFAL